MDVSVICPVFNTHPFLLAAAVSSVLDQAGPHSCELILVDDASTDHDTRKALREAATADSRVRVVVQDTNSGPSQARETGVQHSTHPWLGFLDSDDMWREGRLQDADAILLERPDSRWIGGRFSLVFPGQRSQLARLLTEAGVTAEAGRLSYRLATPGLTRVLVGDWQPLGASLVRKDLFRESGGFDHRLLYGEDWLLNLRLSTIAPMDYTEIPAYVVRRQGLSMMRSPRRMSARLIQSVQVARRDPALRFIKRELRWFLYANWKDLAMNNALNGSKIKATLFALRALMTDPREVKEFSIFLSNLRRNGPVLAEALQRYSTAEQVMLTQMGPQHAEVETLVS